MTPSQYDYLDQLVRGVRETGDGSTLGGLSSGERIYAALAANRTDLLPLGHSIVSGLDRLEPSEVKELIVRWRFASS